MGQCKEEVTPLLTRWSYVFLIPTHWCKIWILSSRVGAFPSSCVYWKVFMLYNKLSLNSVCTYQQSVTHVAISPYQLISYEHYNDVIMSAMASQITSFTIVYSTVYSGTDQRKHQSSASLAFVRGIHRSPWNYLPETCLQNGRLISRRYTWYYIALSMRRPNEEHGFFNSIEVPRSSISRAFCNVSYM